MNKAQKLYYLCKEIGIPQLTEFALYQFALKTGQIAKKTPPGGLPPDFELQEFKPSIHLAGPDKQSIKQLQLDSARIIKNAKEVIQGFYHPFGGEAQPLSFNSQDHSSRHWTFYSDNVNGQDIKWIWEPARFSWAFDLARAYLIRPDERFVQCFWRKFSEFEDHNPVNCGPNWASAQEAAMRILTWTMVYQVFKDSPATTSDHINHLYLALWQHAARIPPTLGYARSQNNNHRLSEALGLIIAGSLFSEKSAIAKKWLRLGMAEFNQGLLNQIEPDGTYGQHSTNYHRLMIQLSLVYFAYAKSLNTVIPDQVSERLAAATRWMVAQLDPTSGRLPNLGHNDGTLLLPMGCEEYRDYRPTLQAASLCFLGEPCLPPGKWDELSAWFGLVSKKNESKILEIHSPAVHKISRGNAWATLRGVQFHGRPGHADQLHLDFWWDGINLAQDAGTFSYNDPAPWQNPFSSTLVHNTVVIDEKDQMQRVGKFLWLEQATAKWLPTAKPNELSASHNGYRKLGVIHQRTALFETENQLLVTDLVRFGRNSAAHKVTLHWLLPDWWWCQEDQKLILEQDNHKVELFFSVNSINKKIALSLDDFSIIRGGETLQGSRKNPILGWASDTYGSKAPALSFSVTCRADADLQFITRWRYFIQPEARKV